jgi:hypothetical protein
MTSSGASVAWNTNEASDTQVEYGTSTAYGAMTSLNGSMLTSHGVTLSALTAGTLYHYRVRSRDAAGNLSVSGDLTFTTTTIAVPGQFNLSSATYTADEGGGTVLVTVTRTGGTAGTVSIMYATSDGTALAGGDYSATSGILTFADGETAKMFTIPIVDDAVSEGAETFNIALSTPTGGATLGARATAIATIQDNDVLVPPVVNPLANNIAYDAAGNLVMAYFDGDTSTLKYAVGSDAGTWSSIQVVDSTPGAGTFLSLAMDSAGHAGIAYFDATNADLKYAHFNGSTWDVQTVDSTYTTGYYPSLKYSPTDKPAISYYSKTGGDLKLAQGGSSGWTISTIDSRGDVGRYGTMVMNPGTGRWAIAYEDTTHGTFRYAAQTKRGWSKTTADGSTKSGGGYISLAFNAKSNLPEMSYYDAYNADLKFASFNGSTWSAQTVAGRGQVGLYSNLRINADTGATEILYFNKGINGVFRAQAGNGGWGLSQVASNGGRWLTSTPAPDGAWMSCWLGDSGIVVAEL